ncbi:PREDICTED: desiccation [Prunus dulcis]|uniref:PREDICTED: desiccation n=1 Tax=Prunus dulcis TaxID=3755 RepID=A0A5E4F7J8_PRUDU|nr:PREDICTED: desiccation [Prunus dulcis]
MSELLEKAKNYVAEKVGHVKKPEAEVTDVDFKKVSFGSVEYLAKISVTNPYGVDLPICDITYNLKSVGRLYLELYQILVQLKERTLLCLRYY